MDIKTILSRVRTIWPNNMSLPEIGTVMGVVYGDICRHIRKVHEGGTVNENELKKEFGNMIASTIRWCDDLGYDPEECVKLAEEAQQNYAQRLKRRQEV